MMNKILLVEDDEFKAADILKVLVGVLPDFTVERANSVTSALRHISTESYRLVILDMSLPTFALSGPGGGGSPQGQGGLEVLRLAGKLASKAEFIVVTQYPDIEIDGKELSLKSASKVLRNRFDLDVRHCILYEFDSDSWRAPFREALFSLMSR